MNKATIEQAQWAANGLRRFVLDNATSTDLALSSAALTWLDEIDSALSSAESEPSREALREAVITSLGDAMDCTRVWSAWGYGTMCADDFSVIVENGDRLEEIVDAIITAISSANTSPSSTHSDVSQDGGKGETFDERKIITATLLETRLLSMQDEDGGSLRLVDALSAGGTIETGKSEIEIIADSIAAELADARACGDLPEHFSQLEAPALTDEDILMKARDAGLWEERRGGVWMAIGGQAELIAFARALLSAPVQAAVEPKSDHSLADLRDMLQAEVDRLIAAKASPDAQAIRDQALEEAAKVCEGRIGGAIQSNEWWGGFKSAIKQCVTVIRALKPQAPQPSQVKEPPVSLTSGEGEIRQAAYRQVRCEDANGIFHVHSENETCDVCEPAAEADERELPQWRVGEFWSSSNPGKKVLGLSVGGDIATNEKHHDFIRWVGSSTTEDIAQSPARQEPQIVRDHDAEKIARTIEEVVDCGGFDVRDQREALTLEEVCIAVVRRLCIEQQPDIKAMVDRFLGWRLPEDFAPDCGISFKREGDYDHPQHGRHKFEPIGTNLLTADQAKAMFEYCMAAPKQGEKA